MTMTATGTATVMNLLSSVTVWRSKVNDVNSTSTLATISGVMV